MFANCSKYFYMATCVAMHMKPTFGPGRQKHTHAWIHYTVFVLDCIIKYPFYTWGTFYPAGKTSFLKYDQEYMRRLISTVSGAELI